MEAVLLILELLQNFLKCIPLMSSRKISLRLLGFFTSVKNTWFPRLHPLLTHSSLQHTKTPSPHGSYPPHQLGFRTIACHLPSKPYKSKCPFEVPLKILFKYCCSSMCVHRAVVGCNITSLNCLPSAWGSVAWQRPPLLSELQQLCLPLLSMA